MNNEDFFYYTHKTDKKDYNKFFSKGIIVYDSTFRIESTMLKISDDDIKNGRLQEHMKALRDTDDNCFLIKIPKSYFPQIIHRDGSMDVPIPFLYENMETDPNTGITKIFPILIPNLIQGCYNREKEFITNPNYCPVFDPSGLKFAYEQINPIKNQNYGQYIQYEKRNDKGSFKQLYDFDKQTGTWNDFINYYSNKFKIQPISLFDSDSINQGNKPKTM